MNSKITKNQKSRDGKITVKHFINVNLKEAKAKYAHFDEEGKYTDMTPPFHPLYVKITFQRATTQMKSLIGLDFTSVEEAQFHCRALLEMEEAMISDVIQREYKKSGNRFSLKGLGEKCKPYALPLEDFLAEELLINTYNKAIASTGSPYAPLLTWQPGTTSGLIYFSAAEKLLGKLPELNKLKDHFKMLALFEAICAKSKLGSVKLVQWIYGDARDLFREKAEKAGFKAGEVFGLVNAIDDLIRKRT